MWIVSAYHVLCNASLIAYISDEAVYQPAAVAPENRVATTRAARANADLDCAAAQLDAGITGLNYQLGIGPAATPIEPEVGMRVVKSGAASGVTEGIVIAVSGSDVVVQIDPSYPTDFVLSLPGDSGAVWLEQQSRSPVGLHSGRQSPRRAAAVSLPAVLAALRLKPLPT
jgi:hypothetical protein